MADRGVGFPGRARRRRLAGLILSVTGLFSGLSLPVNAQEPVAPVAPGGPMVSIKLQQGETLRGALLECRNGWVRLQVEGEASERLYTIAEVAGFDFSAPAAALPQTAPVPDVFAPPTSGSPVDQQPDAKGEPGQTPDLQTIPPKDEPRRPLLEPFFKRRPFAEERRKRMIEMIKQRSDERLTPEERKRMHDLIQKEGNLTPTERQELEQLRGKVELVELELLRQVISEAVGEARQAQEQGTLGDYVQKHLAKLGSATAEDERPRQIASLFAATYVGARDTTAALRGIAVAWMRSTRADPALLDEKVKELRVMYEVFVDEVERSEAPPDGR